MKNIITLLSMCIFITINAQEIKTEDVKRLMAKVADWQIQNHGNLEYRAQNKRLSRGNHHLLDWTNGAL